MNQTQLTRTPRSHRTDAARRQVGRLRARATTVLRSFRHEIRRSQLGPVDNYVVR